jgi:hypothetical protein
MAWLKKNKDPISDRARALQTEIAQLEAQIQRLSKEEPPNGAPDHGQPRVRSTALPHGATVSKVPAPVPPQPAREQVFEEVDHKRLQTPAEAANKALFNELGVRKYDLPGAWQRMRNHLRGAPVQNQTFVKLLAAGNIQGLRPLRYEKRVARRRFVAFVVILFAVLWIIIAMFLRH